jgi:pimeloyl-ACP methyl ester carboxylesterase/predicted transcriptional regulator
MLRTTFGVIEYADRGAGTPLLVSHGVLGCHVDGVDGYWSTLPGPGFRVIAPARFGYFGSTLPRRATPADQANAYALLLDHLGVERAVVMGYSAGTASVLELAGRHPDRVVALILASARLGGGVTLSRRLEPALRIAYGSDLLFWIFKKVMPTTYARMMGAPKGYRPTPAEARTLAAYRELLFPFKPRRDGAIFDGYVSNPVADRFPLENLHVPTLVISAVDDRLAPYRFAATAAARIPAGRHVSEADLLRDVEVVGQHATLATGQATADAAVAAALMTAPAVTATRETSVVAAARRLKAKRIKRMPVVDGEGRLVGIVSRRDLLRMHTRSDSEIRTDVVDNVLRRSLHLDPLTVQVDVVNGVVTLSGRVESNSVARLVVRLTAEVAGVADVVDRISWRYDDFMVSTGPTHQHAGRGF